MNNYIQSEEEHLHVNRKALKSYLKKLLKKPALRRTKDDDIEIALCQDLLEQSKPKEIQIFKPFMEVA